MDAAPQQSSLAAAPQPIRRLAPDVVARVAAGEVIHRPSSALKELLENSLDAGSTNITVTVKDGGNKLLQVTDNGCGIRVRLVCSCTHGPWLLAHCLLSRIAHVQADDLPLLCERHATSKIRVFEDLQHCSTFGFRGEALASMSFVSHLTVTTMPADATCALRAEYADGNLVGAPTPCAGVQGTTSAVEDLFYNVITRRKALKGAAEEYSRVLDVVQRYALLRTAVGFTVRKQGDARADLHVSPSRGVVDRVRAVYGAELAKSLVPFVARSEAQHSAGAAVAGSPGAGLDSDAPTFQCDGYVSGPSYSAKRSTFILFINGRLVECGLLRRALEAVYATVLPRDAKAWLFLSVTLPPSHVDVNIHPTKAEVAFLHADQLAASASAALHKALEAANGERAFVPGSATQPATAVGVLPPVALGQSAMFQSALPFASQEGQGAQRAVEDGAGGSTQRERAGGDHKLVRTDAQAGKLDKFVRRVGGEGGAQLMLGRSDVQQSQLRGAGGNPDMADAEPDADEEGDEDEDEDAAMDDVRRNVRARRSGQAPPAEDALRAPAARAPSPPPCDLTSVCELLAECEAGAHAGLSDVFRRHTFVGLAHPRLALLQHGTRLYITHVPRVSTELMRQLTLRRFGRHAAIAVVPPAPVVPLLLDAIRERGSHAAGGSDAEDTAAVLGRLLLEKSAMLEEYLALQLCAEPNIEGGIALLSLPELLPGHVPDACNLPEFLLRLANQTRWTQEKPCFADLATHISRLYAWRPHAGATADDVRAHEWSVENVLFPALRTHLHPPSAFASDGTMLQVACLEQLYRVFERC